MRISWRDYGIFLCPDIESENVDKELSILAKFYDALEEIGTIQVGEELLTGNPDTNSVASSGSLDDQDTVA